jgi:dynein heavy chain, axonemal
MNDSNTIVETVLGI